MRCCSTLPRAPVQPVGVNQNFLHHPAFVRLRDLVAARSLGKPNFVGCIYNVPLRQLAARQFGHWMFATPVNLLLEQAVHPLSQIAALAGTIRDVAVQAGPAIELAPGVAFHASLDASLDCADLPAQLRFAVGQSFPFWQVTVVCDDGVAVADILANRLITYRRTRWMEAIDGVASGARTAAAVFGDGWRNFGSIRRRDVASDASQRCVLPEHAREHRARFMPHSMPDCRRRSTERSARCWWTPASAWAAPHSTRCRLVSANAAKVDAACDVAILGGTGFIGTHVVRRFVAEGARVAVMARSVRNLPAIFDDHAVTLHAATCATRMRSPRRSARHRVVVNLAHGGGGASWEAVRDAMVGGAETVARACRTAATADPYRFDRGTVSWPAGRAGDRRHAARSAGGRTCRLRARQGDDRPAAAAMHARG